MIAHVFLVFRDDHARVRLSMTNQFDLTQRIATSSVEAATGYASAAMAAYVDFTGHVMGFWANTFDAMVARPEPRSWYRHPDEPGRSQPPGFMGFGWMSAFAPQSTNPSRSGAYAPVFDPFSLWLKAWPLQGNPAAWPMAFMMMGMGMPRSVAYPLAQANAAAMDAVNATKTATEESFACYRSNTGFASAQIRFKPDTAVAALMMLPALLALAPWLNAFASMSRTF